MPNPNNKGKTITFAKLNGRMNKADAELVIRAARINGKNISIISRNRLVRKSTSIPIRMMVVTAAWVNAWTTVFPASNIETGAPVACGAIS